MQSQAPLKKRQRKNSHREVKIKQRDLKMLALEDYSDI